MHRKISQAKVKRLIIFTCRELRLLSTIPNGGGDERAKVAQKKLQILWALLR